MTSARVALRVLVSRKSNDAKFQKVYSAFVKPTCIRYLSTKTLNEETEITVREKINLSRPSVVKWKRPPFVKNLFLGKFDTELLAFPEILSKENLEQLEKTISALNDLYREKVNSFKIDEERRIPEDVLQEFREMGLFGRLAPATYGGLELTCTEYVRLNEVIGLDWSLGTVLGINELFGTKALLLVGNEEQKEKYLPDLVSGKKFATLCSYENNSGSDPTSVETTATLTEDGKSYSLNGIKTWVTNAVGADLYMVLAKLPKISPLDEAESVFFLVDKNTDGVKASPMSDVTCLRGAAVGVVHFKEVIVPIGNMLGEKGYGHLILNTLYETCRFGMGSLTIGALKTFLDHVTEFVINAERNEKSLADFALVRKRLAQIAQRIYGMESISYFTAAIYDSTENPDCTVESAIMKVYNSEGTLFCIQEFMKVVGVLSLSNTQHLERFHRDAQGLALFETPNDIVRLFIGLSGCQFVGNTRAEEVEKWRNPLFFPWDALKSFLRYRRIVQQKYKYSEDVAGNLHPSLVPYGNSLEECVQMLDASVDRMLTQHGRDIQHAQFDPIRLADMVIDIYAMTAVLSRTSRSYCIGLRNNDYEIKLAYAFCDEARKRVDAIFREIIDGGHLNTDAKHLSVGEQVVDLRGFFPEHPLKHNF